MSALNCIDPMSGLPADHLPLPSWRTWFSIGCRKLAGDVRALIEALAEAGERYRQRRALQSLDDSILKDIGLSRADVWREARKSIWEE